MSTREVMSVREIVLQFGKRDLISGNLLSFLETYITHHMNDLAIFLNELNKDKAFGNIFEHQKQTN
jgi:hypothetical protein